MKRVKFCFGIHNHQPVGNFGWVIEEAFQKSYFAFLNLLEKYPGVRISLHFTGILYDWMKYHHPEGIDLVAKLVARGQVELLTGGYFEPILPAIPDRDKVGQIVMLNELIKSEFGVTPTGMWLAERVWEPTLPKYLHDAGVKYTILDDIHFRYSGLQEEQLHGYYVTEEDNKTIALFPIAKRLRYTIPFAEPQETIEYLRGLADEDCSKVGIYADDGEKFGVWPKTYEHCFEKGWLERFFRAISDNLDWIEMRQFGELLSENQPLGRVYLPTASYSEMNEWAMPAAAIELYDRFVGQLKEQKLYDKNVAFVKGGFWRNFLAKYPESNQLHKRMLYVSELLELNKADLAATDYEQALRHLYASQCNCPYWHGVFGGLYLPHLRGAEFQEALAAERVLLQNQKSTDLRDRVENFDFDADGRAEFVVTTAAHKAVIAPSQGGMITELDDFSVCKNLVDVVGRRKEGYHQKLLHRHESSGGETKSIHDLVLVKEEGLENLLVEDQYLRGLFIDHFFDGRTTLEDFVAQRYSESGDFVGQAYQCEHKIDGKQIIVELRRPGQVMQGAKRYPVTVAKSISFDTGGKGITADYRVTNNSAQKLDVCFGVEMDFGSYTFPLRESAILTAADEVIDSARAVGLASVGGLHLDSRLYQFRTSLAFSRNAALWTHPLWTVSLSEGGFEKVYQGAIIVPRWQISLAAGESWQLRIGFSFRQLTSSDLSRFQRQNSDQVRT